MDRRPDFAYAVERALGSAIAVPVAEGLVIAGANGGCPESMWVRGLIICFLNGTRG